MTAERITLKQYARRKTGRMYAVSGVDHTDKAHIKGFYSKEDAEAYAQVLKQDLATDGPRALALPYTIRRDALMAAQLLAPLGITLLDAVRAHIAAKYQNEKSGTVEEVTELFLMEKEAERVSAGHLRTTRLQLECFGRTFGKKTISLLACEEIQDWFNQMAVEPVTKQGYRRALNALFVFANKRKYATGNPIQGIRLPKLKEKPIIIYTVEEMAALLKHAEGEILAFIALGAFAGLRSAEIGRLDWSDIRWDQGTIEIRASIAKTAQRRFVYMSENLKAWLKPLAKASGPILPPIDHKTLYRHQVAVAKKAGMKWKKNALRRSYASYQIAVSRNANDVSWEMGNSPRMVYRHYRELVSRQQAEAYWKIYPEEPSFLALKVA